MRQMGIPSPVRRRHTSANSRLVEVIFHASVINQSTSGSGCQEVSVPVAAGGSVSEDISFSISIVLTSSGPNTRRSIVDVPIIGDDVSCWGQSGHAPALPESPLLAISGHSDRQYPAVAYRHAVSLKVDWTGFRPSDCIALIQATT